MWTFTLNVAAVDHVNHTMTAIVFSYMTENQANLGEQQKIQSIGAGCSDVVFSIVSLKETATLVVYAKDHAKIWEYLPLRVVIKFAP